MSIHRANLLKHLVWATALCLASTASAQVRIPYENTINDLQFFAPVDHSQYGDKPYLKEGFYFTADAISWSVAKPERSVVGSPFATQAVFNVITLQDLPFPEHSSLDTGALDNVTHVGQRYEIGCQDSCGIGWQFGMFNLQGRKQRLAYGEAAVIFDDPNLMNQGNFIQVTANTPFATVQTFDLDINGNGIYGRYGPDEGTFVVPFPGAPQLTFVPDGTTIVVAVTTFVPGPGGTFIPTTQLVPFTGFKDGIPEALNATVTPFDLGDIRFAALDFDTVTIITNTHVNNYELIGTARVNRFILGGHLDLTGGVRYMEYDEIYRMEGLGHIAPLASLVGGPQPPTSGGLVETMIDNNAVNRILGPQIGLRYFHTWGCLTGSFEARAVAGVNAQAIKMRSNIGSDPSSIIGFQKAGNDSVHLVEFSPIGELRFNFSYQLTRAIAARAGWTGTYVENLARPSNMINYELPNTTINSHNNSDDAFMQGWNVGLEINR